MGRARDWREIVADQTTPTEPLAGTVARTWPELVAELDPAGPMAGPVIRPRSAGAPIDVIERYEPVSRAELVAWWIAGVVFGFSIGAFLWAPV